MFCSVLFYIWLKCKTALHKLFHPFHLAFFTSHEHYLSWWGDMISAEVTLIFYSCELFKSVFSPSPGNHSCPPYPSPRPPPWCFHLHHVHRHSNTTPDVHPSAGNGFSWWSNTMKKLLWGISLHFCLHSSSCGLVHFYLYLTRELLNLLNVFRLRRIIC